MASFGGSSQFGVSTFGAGGGTGTAPSWYGVAVYGVSVYGSGTAAAGAATLTLFAPAGAIAGRIATSAASATLSAPSASLARKIVATPASVTLSAPASSLRSAPFVVGAAAATLTLSAAASNVSGVVTATRVARGTIEVMIAWEIAPAGAITLAADDSDTSGGVIAADDTDIASGVIVGDEEETFTGPYDDVSGLVSTAVIERGRDSLLETMTAGTAALTLRDPTGLFNYANELSPLFGQLEGRMHPIRIRIAQDGVWRTRFYGFTRRVRWRPTGRKGVAEIECVDLFYRLDRAKPIIAPTGTTTTGAAIGLILDAIGWSDPAWRNLDAGDDIPDFSADGTATALDLIGGLLEAERGLFYVSADGVATYEDRHARLARSSEATVVDLMTNLEPEVDFDLVRNRTRVTRVDAAGDDTYTAEATDVDSALRLGYADADLVRTPYLISDSQADGLAEWILAVVVEPTSPLRDLVIDGREPALLDTILDLELIDKLTVAEAVGGTVGDFHVERERVTFSDGGRVSGTYLLSRASPFDALLVAADDTDTGVGTIAADDSDTLSLTIVY